MVSGTENEAATWFGEAWNGLIAADPAWVGVWVAVGIFLFGGVWFVLKLLFRGKPKDGGQTTTTTDNVQATSFHGNGNTVNQPGRDQTTIGTQIQGFTPEQFEEQLAKRTEYLTAQIKDLYRQQAELMAQRNGGNEQALADIAEALRLAEAGRADAEAKRADLENAYKAQVEEMERLKAELNALQEDAPGIDAERLRSALAALDENRTEDADALLAELQHSNADTAAIARQARVHYERGRLAEDRIDYATAKAHFIRSAQLAPENEDYLFKAQSLANKAGDYGLGLRYARDLLALAKRDGDDTLAYARACNEVASNLDDQGRYDEAEPLFRRTLKISERVLGTDHPNTATSYNNLAANLHAQGRLAEAEPLFCRALGTRVRVLRTDHPETAISYNNLASNLNAQERYVEAAPLYRRALEIRERVLGTNHPSTAVSYNNVAGNLNAQGRHAEAEPLYQHAMEILERVLGTDHPSTAASYNNVAGNLNAQGRYAEAEPLFRRALGTRVRVLGTDHPETAASYNNLAANLSWEERLAEAEPLYRKAVEIAEQRQGPEHPDSRRYRANMEALEQRLRRKGG